jgi:hypothetical protein
MHFRVMVRESVMQDSYRLQVKSARDTQHASEVHDVCSPYSLVQIRDQ